MSLNQRIQVVLPLACGIEQGLPGAFYHFELVKGLELAKKVDHFRLDDAG